VFDFSRLARGLPNFAATGQDLPFPTEQDQRMNPFLAAQNAMLTERALPALRAFKQRPANEPTTDVVDRTQVLKRLEWLARFLDDAIWVPGTRYTIGWDGIIGLVPGIGDVLTTLTSAYILWEAHRLGVSTRTLGRMLANIGIDLVAGAVPVLGDLFDLGWMANRRNLKLLHAELFNEAAPGVIVE
jgi:hypothetical protein